MFKRQLPVINYTTLASLSEEQESLIRQLALTHKISILEAAHLYFSNDNRGNKTLEMWSKCQ